MTVPPETLSLVRQCAEKYLKALLVLHSVPFPKIHDLLELLPLVPKAIALRLEPIDVATVNRYAIEGRYPGDWEPITREDAEEAVEMARKVREAVRRHLPDAVLK